MFRKAALLLVLVTLLANVLPARADGPVTLGLGTLTSMALSPDGARLAVGTTIGVYFYDAQTFAPQEFWETDIPVDDLLWSPRGDALVLSRGSRSELRVVVSGVVLWAHDTCWYCARSFSNDGARLVTISRDQSVATVYDVLSGAFIEKIEAGGFWPLADWRIAQLALTNVQSADGKIAVVSKDPQQLLHAFVYDVPHRALTNKVLLDDSSSYTVFDVDWAALSPNGKLLAISDTTSRIGVWTVGENKPLYRLDGHHIGYGLAHTFAWSPDGRTLYSAAYNTVYAWDMATGAPLRSIDGFSSAVQQVTWSSDGRRILAIEGEQLVAADVASRQPVRAAWLSETQRPQRWWVRTTELVASPSGNLLAAGDQGGVTLYDAFTLVAVHRLQVGHRVVAIAFSPDGKYLALGGNGPFVNIWDATTGRGKQDLLASSGYGGVTALTFSADSQALYTLEANGRLQHWELATGTATAVQTPVSCEYCYYGYYDPAIHPATQRVATERREGIAVSDTATGALLYNLDVRWPRSIIINSSGARVAAIVGSAIKVWNLGTGELVAEYSSHTGEITDLSFSPDGHSLASGSRDGTIRIWPVP